jgi:isopentenyl-diphosphate delta-isomerase
MIEHESNDIYQGVYDGEVVINPEEACDYKWVSFSEILDELTQNPQAYTEWFKYLLLETPLGSELSVSITAQSVQRDG